VISHGLPICVALEPVDMRLGFELLGGLVREKMATEPRSRALFVFVGKRGLTMKVSTWDGTGVVLVHKKLDAGKFSLPRATRACRSPACSDWICAAPARARATTRVSPHGTVVSDALAKIVGS